MGVDWVVVVVVVVVVYVPATPVAPGGAWQRLTAPDGAWRQLRRLAAPGDAWRQLRRLRQLRCLAATVGACGAGLRRRPAAPAGACRRLPGRHLR